jgi:hypothetical protein
MDEAGQLIDDLLAGQELANADMAMEILAWHKWEPAKIAEVLHLVFRVPMSEAEQRVAKHLAKPTIKWWTVSEDECAIRIS